jgi:hypothetical protein
VQIPALPADWGAMLMKPAQAIIASLAALTLIGIAVPAEAAQPKPKKFANCAALNKVYPHGVAKKKSVAGEKA